MSLRLALYGDIDLNLVDGSAVWLASAVRIFSRGGENDISLFLKARDRRPLFTEELRRLPKVSLWGVEEMEARGVERLAPPDVVELILEHDRQARFDLVLVRGRRVARIAAEQPALAGRLWWYAVDLPQHEEDLTLEVVAEAEVIAGASRYVLCQTEELRTFLEWHFPALRGKILLLPPMIPSGIEAAPGIRVGAPTRLVYAGKLAPQYGAREMIGAFERLRRRHPQCELHVFGDKIHDPKEDRGFRPEMEKALDSTAGLIWHRAIGREQLLVELPTMDIAWGWRHAEMSASLELSTKVLEYGAAGLPVILAPGPLYEQLLGENYPLFAESIEDVEALLDDALGSGRLLEEAARATHRASRAYTFDRIFERHLAGPLEALRAGDKRATCMVSSLATPTLLAAGHDLRFLEPLLRRFAAAGWRVLYDRWTGHSAHRPDESRRQLAQADVIWCEWCLGNAVWYSQHKQPEQRLFVRFHRQERETPYPTRLRIDQVEWVIFIADHVRRDVVVRQGWLEEQTLLVPNAIEIDQFRRPKLEGFRHNLGIVGVCPRMKRLDRALTILEQVRAKEPLFKLYVKSRMPWEYDWLWRRDEEREYYGQVFRRIRRSPLLREAVIFEDYGNDVPLWLRKVGFLLSVSDYEGSHHALAEGAVAGTIPVVVRWPGAEEIFPARYVHDGCVAAAEAVLRLARYPDLGALQEGISDEFARRQGAEVVAGSLLELLSPAGGQPVPAPPAEGSSPVRAPA